MVVIGIFLVFIIILFMIIFMLISRLRRMKHLLKATMTQFEKEEIERYEIGDKEMKTSLGTQNKTRNHIHSESGFGSEASHNGLDDFTNINNLYASADSGRLKKGDYTENLHFSKAINSIDETLRLLKDTADQI
jgi:hypothetical protein